MTTMAMMIMMIMVTIAMIMALAVRAPGSRLPVFAVAAKG